MVDITKVVIAAAGLVFAIAVAFVIPYIKTRISGEKLVKLMTYVRIAVEAAEQIYNESGMGAAKKAYVEQYLAKLGYTLNQDELDAYIESAVLEMKNELFR